MGFRRTTAKLKKTCCPDNGILFDKRSAKMILVLLLLVVWACATSPVTGRSQLMMVSEKQEIALGLKSYKQILSEAKLCPDPKITAMVNRVGQRIAQVTERPDYDWEFKVIDDDKTANAFALPGGKVAVYTGLFRYTVNETGLAFVFAHEVAHAIAAIPDECLLAIYRPADPDHN